MKRLALFIVALLLIPSAALADTTEDYVDLRETYATEMASIYDGAFDESDTTPITDYAEAGIALAAQVIADIDSVDMTQLDSCYRDDVQLLLDIAWADLGLWGYVFYVNTGSIGLPLDEDDVGLLLDAYGDIETRYNDFDPDNCGGQVVTPVVTDDTPDTSAAVERWGTKALEQFGNVSLAMLDDLDSLSLSSRSPFNGTIKAVDKALRWTNNTNGLPACVNKAEQAFVKQLKAIKKTAQALNKNWNNNGSVAQWDRLLAQLTRQQESLGNAMNSVFDRCDY